MRILIDTNIIISYALFKSAEIRQTLEIAWDVGNVLVIPDYVIAEAEDVIMRKWPTRLDAFHRFIGRIRFEEVVTPDEVEVDLGIRDPKDLPVLRAAIHGGVDVIVTGDKDFVEANTGGVRILSPSDFVDLRLSGLLN